MKKIAILQLCLMFVCVAFAVVPDADGVEPKAEPANREQLEEAGLDARNVVSTSRPRQKLQLNRLDQVLLIPESNADVVGMYDPFDGTYLGDLIVDDTSSVPQYNLQTPINAVPGPDGNIYVSDQVSDAVYVFDTTGTFLLIYADATDGLNNIRGIDFRDGHLFVTSGDDYVREFSGPHVVVGDFIADGSDPFDILFLEDGRSLLCDIQGTTDNVRLYDTSGTLINQVFSVAFPEQVQFDAVLPGEFLNASFSDNIITDFELNGTIVGTFPHSGGRGIYRLGNGNFLATNGTGIHELDSATGALVQTENTGSGRFIELYTPPTAQSTLWDFETGLQAWTHTNGMPFPAGWDVEPSGTHASQTPPAAGDSCFWVDSDAGGSAFWIQDSALSPVCTPNSGMDWLKYGFCNYGGSGSYLNELHVGIKHSTGGVWTATELAFYPSGMTSGPAWDSVDVSAYTTADFVQVYFYFDDLNTWGYWASFDNVEIGATPYAADHDVGCTEVVSPPEGSTTAGDKDVTGRIQNFGNNTETFDAMAVVYDTVGMTQVFSQSVTLTDFPVAGDSNVNFGTVTFAADSYYYTEIYTMLTGDSDPSNDTSAVYSTTAISFGDVIFELDAQAVVTDNQLLGIEFDGERFYLTGGGNAADPNKVYVVDTAGTLLWSLDQPSHSTGWGWRDVAWDDVYVGPDRIDTLYASVNTNVDKFSIDLTGGVLTYHGFSPGAQNPNRALAYKPDSGWFYTANFSSSCYKFDKSGVIVQSVPNTLAMYGAAYDGDTTGGPYVWWHSQDDPGSGFLCQISQMDAQTMTFTGLITGFAMPAALTDAIAGGLCFYSGFNDMDVLFAMLQGTPNDYIVGIYVRPTPGTGIAGKPGDAQPLAFGFAPTLTTVSRGRMPIAYSTTVPGHVSLKVYDNMGRLVQTLVNAQQPAGEKSVYWDNKDVNQRTVSNGVYFLKLEAADETAVHKLILMR